MPPGSSPAGGGGEAAGGQEQSFGAEVWTGRGCSCGCCSESMEMAEKSRRGCRTTSLLPVAEGQEGKERNARSEGQERLPVVVLCTLAPPDPRCSLLVWPRAQRDRDRDRDEPLDALVQAWTALQGAAGDGCVVGTAVRMRMRMVWCWPWRHTLLTSLRTHQKALPSTRGTAVGQLDGQEG